MKFQFVDSIRGIAILMVILVHTVFFIGNLNYITVALANYAQMGVQLFFVASAYTLCLSNKARKEETNSSFNYFIRRYFRIAPIYYLGIILYFSLAFLKFKLTGNSEDLDNYSLKKIASNILFIHGFYSPANNVIVPVVGQ